MGAKPERPPARLVRLRRLQSCCGSRPRESALRKLSLFEGRTAPAAFGNLRRDTPHWSNVTLAYPGMGTVALALQCACAGQSQELFGLAIVESIPRPDAATF